MITKHEALDTLDRLEFFQGQRAGRELWFEKNSQLQDIDIACFVRDLSNLREYIQAADVAPRAEWISIEERLPQVTGKYICCVKDKCGNTWTVPADWNFEMKMWFGEFGEIKNMVTHWMPLPEPPKMKGGAK